VRLLVNKSVLALVALLAFQSGPAFAGFISARSSVSPTQNSGDIDYSASARSGSGTVPVSRTSGPLQQMTRAGRAVLALFAPVATDEKPTGGDGLPREKGRQLPTLRDEVPCGDSCAGSSATGGVPGSSPAPAGLYAKVEIHRSEMVARLWGEREVRFPAPFPIDLFRPPRVVS